jgi:hypothetical protein
MTTKTKTKMKTKTKTLSTVIEDLFGDALSWDDHTDTTGYIPCPGRDKHTHKDGRRDCRVYLSGAPTIWCLHNSCEEDVKDANENLRGALRQFVSLITGLFGEDDRLWMGQPFETGDEFRSSFAPSSVWLDRIGCHLGPFICPNPFAAGTSDRRAENLADKRYFVIEGDDCSPDKDENRDRCGAIFKYATGVKPKLKLRAVVDAGNKSLHGWFEYPGDEIYRWCLDVLPALGADAATMRLTQPVRLPGVTRNNGNEQTLLWISK